MPKPITATIEIHPMAPPQPRTGAPCNGCGVCCLTLPCPLGMVLSAKRLGRCHALRWSDSQSRYLCGAMTATSDVLPRGLKWLAKPLQRMASRWIASGIGCDMKSRFID